MTSNMDKMKELMAKKDTLEAEIKELQDVLDSQAGVGMTGPLVDEEGYPRSDIDVYSVRHARHQIICLQNDHKELMKTIEECLYQIHAEARENSINETTEVIAESSHGPPAVQKAPFARVDRVDAGSPSSTAGLEVDDKLLQFGSVTFDNFQNLQNIAKVVQHSTGRSLPVSVLRNGREVHLYLTPQTWSGRGLLGCNIVPIGR